VASLTSVLQKANTQVIYGQNLKEKNSYRSMGMRTWGLGSL